MQIIAEEQLTIPASNANVVLTQATYDNTGGVRATRAEIQHVEGSVPVYFRFTDDVAAANAAFKLEAGDYLVIDGYDNLQNVRFCALSAGAAKLFIAYGTP